MNRYDSQSNYVDSGRPTQLIELPPADASPVILDGAWLAKDGADERTSGMDRSQALIVRLIPFSFLWLLIAGGVFVFLVVKIQADRTDAGVFCLISFACITAYTYLKMDAQERYDSRHGVEHHKIDSATYLAERKMDQDHEVRKQLIGVYLKQLEGNNGTRSIGGESSAVASRKQLPHPRQPR
jgi:hypothetical protein